MTLSRTRCDCLPPWSGLVVRGQPQRFVRRRFRRRAFLKKFTFCWWLPQPSWLTGLSGRLIHRINGLERWRPVWFLFLSLICSLFIKLLLFLRLFLPLLKAPFLLIRF